jgi:predicted nucleic acid-binding protein
VIIALESIPVSELPKNAFISVLSLAELAAGPHATADPRERASRQDRLQRVEGLFDPLPFDASSARAFGVVYAAVSAAGRKARGRRMVDLLIASTALALELPLYTMNPDDFVGLESLVKVVTVFP